MSDEKKEPEPITFFWPITIILCFILLGMGAWTFFTVRNVEVAHIGVLENIIDGKTIVFADGEIYTSSNPPLFVENTSIIRNVHYNFYVYFSSNLDAPYVKGETYKISRLHSWVFWVWDWPSVWKMEA